MTTTMTITTKTAHHRVDSPPRQPTPPLPMKQVFFQQRAFNKIEKLRTGIVSHSATVVQTFWRGVSCRRAFLIRKGELKKTNTRGERKKQNNGDT